MSSTDQEIKNALLADYEKQLDKILAEYRVKGEKLTLTDIEELALQTGDKTEQAITAELVSDAADQQLVPGPLCEQCGQEMHYKGKKAKQVQTLSGAVTVERSHYYCAACQRGVFPPG